MTNEKDSAKQNITKLCWWCENFYYSAGDDGYSEYTPGYSPSMSCNKDKWTFNFNIDGQEDMEACITAAMTCEHYEKK